MSAPIRGHKTRVDVIHALAESGPVVVIRQRAAADVFFDHRVIRVPEDGSTVPMVNEST